MTIEIETTNVKLFNLNRDLPFQERLFLLALHLTGVADALIYLATFGLVTSNLQFKLIFKN